MKIHGVRISIAASTDQGLLEINRYVDGLVLETSRLGFYNHLSEEATITVDNLVQKLNDQD